MKPINAPVEAASDGRSSKPASFIDPLKAIDVSSLDRLIAIRKDHTRIDEYRAKAEEKKKDVAEAVYQRVVADYTRRAAELEQQSAPLRAQARAEYRKLKALVDALGRTHEQAQLQKDELQFRHTVGELNDGELAAKLTDPQRVLDQCAADRQELDASQARFIEALGSREALEAPEPPFAAPPSAPAPTPAPEPERAARQTDAPPMLEPKPAAAVAQKAADSSRPSPEPPAAITPTDDGATRLVAPVANSATRIDDVPTRAPEPSPVPAPPAPPPPAPEADEGATIMLASAAIVIEDPAGPKEYLLTVVNGIGRSDENRICLSNAGVSRYHAVITAVARGFTIKDLGSQNGTFVNGQRVTEKRLADSDTIDVGSVRFVFRTPWKPAVGATAARGAATTPTKR